MIPVGSAARPSRQVSPVTSSATMPPMIGGLLTSTAFTLLALTTFYVWVHDAQGRLRR
jgi:Cu/Ag efflux pump CusA